MKKSSVNLITLLASIALVGLVAIQVYWINNAIKVGKERFEENVSDALNNVVLRLEKKQTAAKMTKKINFRKQGIRWFTPADSIKQNSKLVRRPYTDKRSFALQKDRVNVKIFEGKQKAMNYYNALIAKKDLIADLPAGTFQTFVISEENYIIFYKDKNIHDYEQFFTKNY